MYRICQNEQKIHKKISSQNIELIKVKQSGRTWNLVNKQSSQRNTINIDKKTTVRMQNSQKNQSQQTQLNKETVGYRTVEQSKEKKQSD